MELETAASARPACHPERLRCALRRAWTEVATLRLDRSVRALERIERSRNEEAELLRAIDAALRDDLDAAAALAGPLAPILNESDHRAAASLLRRFACWKLRDLSGFQAAPRVQVTHRRHEHLAAALDVSLDALVEIEQLRFAVGERLARRALEMSRAQRTSDSAPSWVARTLLAEILYERGQLDAAELLIRDRLGVIGQRGTIEGAMRAYLISARIAAARGERPYAILLLNEAELLGTRRKWWRMVAAALASQVRLLADSGDAAAAGESMKRLDRLVEAQVAHGREPSTEILRYQAVGKISADLARGRAIDVTGTLTALTTEAIGRHELYVALELSVLLARVIAEQGDEEEALALLATLSRVGAAAGLFRTFLDGGASVAGLLQRLSDRAAGGFAGLEALRPYLQNLSIDACGATPRQSRRGIRGPGESLSPREQEIIRLMSHGLSNKRIARELRIGPETVKSHAKHLLTKLGSQTRVEAVSRAFSLGML
jgi:ATP/maltotriose-dependent transcriptional regulator MalT